MNPKEPFVFRTATPSDVELLERFWPTPSVPDIHRQRFTVQTEGQARFLVALHEGVPVGFVLLRFAPPVGQAAQMYPDSTYVEGLAVSDAWQRRGVATRLMNRLETLSSALERPTIGLYVGLENGPARALYTRLGYRPSTLPPFHVTWAIQTESGALAEDGETCDFWLKSLRV